MTSSTRRRSPVQYVAIAVGGVVVLALAIAVTIGLGLLFWLLIKTVAVAIWRALVDGVKSSVT